MNLMNKTLIFQRIPAYRQRRFRQAASCLAITVAFLASFPVIAAAQPATNGSPELMTINKNSSWAPVENFGAGKTTPVPSTTAEEKKEEVTSPTATTKRSINLAPLPGINHDNVEEAPKEIKYTNEKLKIDPESANWKNVDQLEKKPEATELSEEAPAPRAIRLTALPSRNIVPVPAGSATPSNTVGYKKPQPAATPAPASTENAEPVSAEANATACAAIDAYKKKQLAAIESDNKTLAALQAAISKLGLNKKLNFDGTSKTSEPEPAKAVKKTTQHVTEAAAKTNEPKHP